MELTKEIQEIITEISQFLKSKGRKTKSYCSVLGTTLSALGLKFTEKDVEEYLTYRNLAPNTYNNYKTIINFYTKKYLSYELTFTKAKVEKKLPTYVSKEEIKKVISTIPNIKHRLWYAIMYGSGTRVEETAKLKMHNIYCNKLTMMVEGKGNKHRWTIINPITAKALQKFIKKVEAKNSKNPYLFQSGKGHISIRSIQERLSQAIKDSEITKHFTCHSLRHSFAINFLNKTNDLDRLRLLLGHSNISTTQIYTQCRTTDLTALAKEVYTE